MKGLLALELKRRWRSPGAWFFLLMTLGASGTACLLKNVYGGSSDFQTIFNWGIYALIWASPLLVWGSYTADRKNDAWKILFSRRISPMAIAFSRLISAWSVCLAASVCMLGGPAVLCLQFDTLYFPSALCAAAAFCAVAMLSSAFCLWLESCTQRAWQAALTGAISLGCMYLLSLLAVVALSSSRGALLSIVILAAVIFTLPMLLNGSFRGGLILALTCILILGAALAIGGHHTVAQILTRISLFDQMNVFMLSIFDLSIFLSCLVVALLFTVLAGVSLMRLKGRGKGPRRFPRPIQIGAAAVAVCLVAVCLLPFMSPALTRIDATRIRTSTPVPQAQEVLSASDKPVHAYFLTTTDDVWLEALLARYSAIDDRFTYSTVDLTSDPDFGDAYYGAQGQDNCLVLVGEDRYAVIPSVYIYTYTYTYDSASGNYVPTDLRFDAQSRILTAVDFLSADDAPTIAALKGHYESQIGEYARDAVYSSGYFLRYLDLTQDTLDESIDCVLIQNPQIDITESERDMLLDYLKNGGALMMATNYQYNSDCPNLFAVMEYCGMAPSGILAMEADANSYLDHGYYPAPVAAAHDVTAAVAGNRIIVPTAHGITEQSGRDGLVCTPLLSTTAFGYLKNSMDMTTLDFEEGDIHGPVVLAMAAADDAMRTVWVSGDHLADSAIITSGGTNLYFWLGEIQWTTGEIGVSPYVEAPAPSLTTVRLQLSDMQKLATTAASLMIALLSMIVAISLGSRKIKSSRGA